MKTVSKRMLILALLAGVAACGQGSTGDNQAAGNDAMADNMTMDNSAMADPSNPYADAEMRMNDAMMAAVGTDVSDTWVRKMIEHHKGAIEMSNLVIAQGQDPKVREMARKTAAMQQKDVEDLQRMIRQGPPDPASAEAYRAAERQMHDKMMTAGGADASETWTRKMIEHHQGAIAMSEIVIAQGKDERVKAMARKDIQDQRKEIAELQAVLSGAPAAAAAEPPPPAPNSVSPGAAAAPPAATKIAPVPPKAAKPPARPKPAPTPPPMHDMGNMSGHDMANMSH